jgi:polyisoprenoid-binding protein YceI
MKRIFFLMACLLAGTASLAQKYVVEKSLVSFFSDAAIEDIKAENKKAVSIFNIETGEIVFSVPINEFKFEKSLMQEHFNEKYMESDKYPKSTFQGKIVGYNAAQTVQQVKAVGKLTIHGVAKEIEIPGTIEAQGEKLVMRSKFIVKLVDYKIEIPKLLWQNIAEQVEVTLDFIYKP